MREIKFQFLYKGLPFNSDTEDCNWHKKVYSLDQLIEKKLSDLSDVHGTSTLIAKRQFTGLTDKNGVEIYEGDVYFDIGTHGRGAASFKYKNYRVIQFDEIKSTFNAKTHCGSCFIDANCEIVGNIYENPELLESK